MHPLPTSRDEADAYSSPFLTTLVPRRRPVRRAAMRPTFFPCGDHLATVEE